jgi:hypothetical protein
MRDPVENRLAVLNLAHDDVCTERDRLRNARASFTSRLGPLPASAAVVIGLAGSSIGKVGVGWLAGATLLLVLLIVTSTVYAGLAPYRVVRGKAQRSFEETLGTAHRDPRFAFAPDAEDPVAWLEQKIKLEEKICGPILESESFCLRMNINTLQEAVNVEHSASILVQLLFAEIVLGLVLGIALRGADSWIQWLVGGPLALATIVALLMARWHCGFLESGAGVRDRSVREREQP